MTLKNDQPHLRIYIIMDGMYHVPIGIAFSDDEAALMFNGISETATQLKHTLPQLAALDWPIEWLQRSIERATHGKLPDCS